MTPPHTADGDPLDALAAVWAAVVDVCDRLDGQPDEERWLGLAAGLQLAIAVVSGVPAGTPLPARDLIRAGGDIARARVEAMRDGAPW